MDGKPLQLLAVSISFLVPSWVLVVLRCYVRIWVKQFFGADDYLAVASLIAYTALCALEIAGAKNGGIGQHMQDLSPETAEIGLRYFFLGELTYVLSTVLIKLSICVFLLRIAIEYYQIYIIYVLFAVQAIFSTFYFFFLLFQCDPISYFWERVVVAEPGAGSCGHSHAVIKATYAHGAIVSLGDWTLGILPMFIVWNMTLHRRTKISVAILLAFGSIASIATIARIPYVKHLSNSEDFLYANTDIAVWSIVEVGMAIIASAVPTLRPLVGKVRILGLYTDSGESQGRRWSSRAGHSSHR